MRYIDADKILYQDLSEGRGVCWVTFMDWIKKMPTADVRENVRGEWIFPYGNKKYKRCSVCGKTFYSIPATSNFCPNCGAEMGGKS